MVLALAGLAMAMMVGAAAETQHTDGESFQHQSLLHTVYLGSSVLVWVVR